MRIVAVAVALLAFASPAEADVFVSTDGGKTWKAVGLEMKPVDEMVVDPKEPKTAYVFIGSGWNDRRELLQSTDGGQTWIPLSPGFRATCLAIDPADSKVLWAGGDDRVFARSPDGGRTWVKGDVGEAARTDQGFRKNVRGIAIVGKTVWIAGGNGDGFIARSDDAGKTWTRIAIQNGETPRYVWAAAAAGGALLIGGDGGLLVSDDGGKNFAERGDVPHPLGTGGRFSLSADRKRAAFSFRGTTVSSSDGGKTWAALAPPASDMYVYSIAWSANGFVATTVSGKWRTDKKYKSFEPDGGRKLWTRAEGKEWTELECPAGAPSIVISSSDGKTIWLGTR